MGSAFLPVKISAMSIALQWLAAFGGEVSEEFLDEHIWADGNYLWHIFSWEGRECISGDEARAALAELEYTTAYIFHSGYVTDGTLHAEHLGRIGRVCPEALDELGDVYLVAEDFSWTYVHTHEEMCGPYFCRK